MQGVEIRAIPGALIKEKINANPRSKKLPPWWSGYNQCREEQGKVKITLGRERLAIRFYMMLHYFNCNRMSWEELPEDSPAKCDSRNKADDLNAHLNELLVAVKEKK